jgi:hypothetical protein
MPHADLASVPESKLSRSTLYLSVLILTVWVLGGLIESITGVLVFFYSWRAFGLISPLVGVACLVASILGLAQARQLGAPKRHALTAAILSVAIAVLPFAAIPYDPS